MKHSTIIQMILEQFKDHLNDEKLALLGVFLEGMMEGVDEGLKEIKEALLDELLTVFDKQIESEKGERSVSLGRGDSMAIEYANGRIDGVDTGRALVERYFASKESADE